MRGLTSSRGQGHPPEKRTETDVGVNEEKERAGGESMNSRGNSMFKALCWEDQDHVDGWMLKAGVV